MVMLLDNILNIVAIEPQNGARPLSQLNSFNSVSNSTERIAPDRTSKSMKSGEWELDFYCNY